MNNLIKMEEETLFPNLLDRIKSLFNQLVEAEQEPDANLRIKLMDDIFNLGMKIYENPELAQVPPYSSFLSETTELNYLISGHIWKYVYHDLDKYAAQSWWEQGEFYNHNFEERAYHHRSAIEFYLEIYGSDLSLAEHLKYIDEVIAEKQQRDGAEIDKPEMPPSHWWWHYNDLHS